MHKGEVIRFIARESARPKPVGQMSTDELQDAYIRKISRPVNSEGRAMISYALEKAKKHCKNRRSHTYCVAKGRNAGRDYYGKPQLNCSRAREFSQCAEPSVVAEVAEAGDVIVKLVVVHYKPGYSRRTVVPPCYRCIELLRRFVSPQATVIVKYKRDWIEFPIRRFILFPYPTKHKNRKANI